MNWTKLFNHVDTVRLTTWVNSIGILMCLFISAIIDNQALTGTACGPLTYNVIGTISAANNIRSVSLLWQFVIIFSFGVRLLNGFGAYMFLKVSSKRQSSSAHFTRWLNLLFYCLEVFFLLMVAVIPSNELLGIHCSMFLGFAICAFLNQIFRMREFKLSSKHSHEAAKAYAKLKRMLIIGNLILFAALTFSFLHFVSCVSGAYSLFAAFEYLYVIYGNINFHNGSLSSFSDLNRAQYFAISDKLVLNETVRVTPRRRGSSIDSNESAVSRKNSSAKNPKSTVADS